MYRREHSIRELRNKLLLRNFASDDIENALDRLQDLGYLSEQRFCEQYVEMRKNRGFGPVKIINELKERGISSVMIEEFVNGYDAQWFEQARKVKEKKFGKTPTTLLKEKAKQYRYLQYRGYTHEQINGLLD